MENSLSKNTYDKLDMVAAYQVIGGLIGWALAGCLIYKSTDISWILLLMPILFYTFSIYCGVMLFINDESGIKYTLINQFLQLLNFSFAGYAFEYISGLSLSVGVDFSNSINFKTSLSISTWHILINDNATISKLNFNLLALLLIIFIEHLKKKIRKQDAENKLLEFGQ